MYDWTTTFATAFLHSTLVPSSVSANGVVWAMGVKSSAVGLCTVSEVRIIQTQQSVERGLRRGFSLFLVTVFCQVTTARNE